MRPPSWCSAPTFRGPHQPACCPCDWPPRSPYLTGAKTGKLRRLCRPCAHPRGARSRPSEVYLPYPTNRRALPVSCRRVSPTLRGQGRQALPVLSVHAPTFAVSGVDLPRSLPYRTSTISRLLANPFPTLLLTRLQKHLKRCFLSDSHHTCPIRPELLSLATRLSQYRTPAYPSSYMHHLTALPEDQPLVRPCVLSPRCKRHRWRTRCRGFCPCPASASVLAVGFFRLLVPAPSRSFPRHRFPPRLLFTTRQPCHTSPRHGLIPANTAAARTPYTFPFRPPMYRSPFGTSLHLSGLRRRRTLLGSVSLPLRVILTYLLLLLDTAAPSRFTPKNIARTSKAHIESSARRGAVAYPPHHTLT
jgi:hypothetical protein